MKDKSLKEVSWSKTSNHIPLPAGLPQDHKCDRAFCVVIHDLLSFLYQRPRRASGSAIHCSTPAKLTAPLAKK